MTPCLILAASAAASLFMSEPAPLEMPQAKAYLVTLNGRARLEDRYTALDLWTSQAVVGRWTDSDGRVFTLSRLEFESPSFVDKSLTREAYVAGRRRIGMKNADAREKAIARLSSFEMPVEPVSPHIGLNGWEILYYNGEDTTGIACAFLPKGRDTWYFAEWRLVEGDDFALAMELFEEEFLGKWDEIVDAHLPSEHNAAREEKARRRGVKPPPVPPESELLRADARHSVTNYPNWHVTDGREFTVLDDVRDTSGFVTAFTNELTTMRARYAAVMPSPIDGTNTLCVARIFRDRREYEAALVISGLDNMMWSGGYWSTQRREIVAYLPPGGETSLLTTLRHEAFHQYFSYACSMIPISPWLNEGYAEYFEHGPDGPSFLDPADMASYAEFLPLIFAMDGASFYDGTDEERRLKYRLALSVAYFIERGAPKIPREPFKNLKSNYISELLKSRDMFKATSAAFGSEEGMKRFVLEWTRFWQNQ